MTTAKLVLILFGLRCRTLDGLRVERHVRRARRHRSIRACVTTGVRARVTLRRGRHAPRCRRARHAVEWRAHRGDLPSRPRGGDAMNAMRGLVAAIALGASACAQQGAITVRVVEEPSVADAPAGPGARQVPIDVVWNSTNRGYSGTVATALPSGEAFTGQFHPAIVGDEASWPEDPMLGWADDERFPDAWLDDDLDSYAGTRTDAFVALLSGDRGSRMFCTFAGRSTATRAGGQGPRAVPRRAGAGAPERRHRRCRGVTVGRIGAVRVGRVRTHPKRRDRGRAGGRRRLPRPLQRDHRGHVSRVGARDSTTTGISAGASTTAARPRSTRSFARTAAKRSRC